MTIVNVRRVLGCPDTPESISNVSDTLVRNETYTATGLSKCPKMLLVSKLLASK